MSLRKGAQAVLSIDNVRDRDGNPVTLNAAAAWAADTSYDVDDVVTEATKTYKCIVPSHVASGGTFPTADFKEVPANAVLPLMSYNFSDSGGTTTQLFQDEAETARTLTSTSAATCAISWGEVQGDSHATAVQDVIRRGYTFRATINKHGYPAETGDLEIVFAAQVQDRTDQSGENFNQVDATLGVEGSIAYNRKS